MAKQTMPSLFRCFDPRGSTASVRSCGILSGIDARERGRIGAKEHVEHETSRVDELVEVWVEFDVVDVGDMVGECRKRFGIADHVGGDVIDDRIGKRLLVEGRRYGSSSTSMATPYWGQ